MDEKYCSRIAYGNVIASRAQWDKQGQWLAQQRRSHKMTQETLRLREILIGAVQARNSPDQEANVV